MSLPYNHQYPQSPCLFFAPDDSPPHSGVFFNEHTEHLIPKIATAVANEATKMANNNAARMFYYNMLSRDGWQNSDFINAVQFVADFCFLIFKKQRSNVIASCMTEAVTQGMSYLTAACLLDHSELRSYVNEPALSNCDKTNQRFYNLKQEMQMNYTGQTPHLVPVGNVNDPRMADPRFQQQPQYMHPGAQMHPNMQMHPGVHLQHPGYGPGPYGNWGQPAPRAAFNPNQGQSFASGSGHPSTFPTHHGNSAGGPIDRYSVNEQPQLQRQAPRDVRQILQQEHGSRSSQTVINAVTRMSDTNTVEAEPIQTEKVSLIKTPKTLSIIGGSEMERARHVIKYFSGMTGDTLTARYERLANAARSISLVKPSENNGKGNTYVDPNPFVEVNLDAAIFEARERMIEKAADGKDLSAYRCAAFVAEPLIVPANAWESIKKFMDCSSFEQITIVMRVIAMEESRNGTGSEAMVAMVADIDKRLCKVVNDFLRYSLYLQLSIECFCEDIVGLGGYLHEKYGFKYSQALASFETQVMNTMFNSLDKDTTDQLEENMRDSKRVSIMYMPISVSLTFVSFTSNELGYDVKNIPMVIAADTAPVLYSLATSVANVSATGDDTGNIADYLIASDGVRYRLSASELTEGVHFITQL